MSFFTIPHSELIFHEKCGSGSFGSVHRCTWKDKTVAVKKVLTLDHEAEFLSNLSHKNVIQFFGVVSENGLSYLVTEYAANLSLYSILRHPDFKMTFLQVLHWARDISSGMNYLHCEAPVVLIHRDLKSKNVVVTSDWVCKICDFGSSRVFTHTTQMSVIGTWPWMSPEVICNQDISSACDVWSFGVVLWEMLTQEIPFHGLLGPQIAYLVVQFERRLPIPGSCPKPFCDLMHDCWKTQPSERPTFKRINLILDEIIEQDDMLPEETETFFQGKHSWKNEIDSALTKMADTGDVKLDVREQFFKEWESRLTAKERSLSLKRDLSKSSLNYYADWTDVNNWNEQNVYEWILDIGKTETDLCQYSQVFATNHITGRRLFELSKEELRAMGISSLGHQMSIMRAIDQLRYQNHSMINFPPLGYDLLPTGAYSPKSPTKNETSLEYVTTLLIMIGAHVRMLDDEQHCKWKAYCEIDHKDDETIHEDDQLLVPEMYISEVKFIYKKKSFKATQNPFIMDSWCHLSDVDCNVTCLVTFESFVSQPRTKRVQYSFTASKSPGILTTTVDITVKRAPKPSPVRNLSGSASTPRFDTGTGAWSSTANSVEFFIPSQAHGVASPHVWSDVVTEGHATIPASLSANNSSLKSHRPYSSTSSSQLNESGTEATNDPPAGFPSSPYSVPDTMKSRPQFELGTDGQSKTPTFTSNAQRKSTGSISSHTGRPTAQHVRRSMGFGSRHDRTMQKKPHSYPVGYSNRSQQTRPVSAGYRRAYSDTKVKMLPLRPRQDSDTCSSGVSTTVPKSNVSYALPSTPNTPTAQPSDETGASTTSDAVPNAPLKSGKSKKSRKPKDSEWQLVTHKKSNKKK